MKREIKFRAWLKDMQEMIPVHDIKFNGNIGLINTQSDWRMFNEIELMQFTGLYDKNGKEIYEGDLLSHKYYAHPVVVEFKDGSFQAEDVSIFDNSIEIVGNIHENPSLLEVSHDTKI